MKEKAGEVLTHLNEYSGADHHHQQQHDAGESSNESDLIEGLKNLAVKAQDKADEVAEWADNKLDEVKAEFERDPNSPKEEDSTALGDLRESIGKAEQKFEEIVEKAKTIIDERSPSPTEEHAGQGDFVQTSALEHEIHEHRPSPDDLTAEEKHGSQGELPIINDPVEGIAGPTSPDDKEHLVVEEDIHRHASEPVDSVTDNESKSKEGSEQPEVPLETYEEPAPQTDDPIDEEFTIAKTEDEDITKVVIPEATAAFADHHTSGTHDTHMSDVVDQVLNDDVPMQIDDEETLPPPNTHTPPPNVDSVPTQIIVEDVDVTGNFEGTDASKQTESHGSVSPPQLASQEHTPLNRSSSTSSSSSSSADEKQPSPPVYKEGTPASADIPIIVETTVGDVVHDASSPLELEGQHDLPPLDVEKEPASEIKEQSHREVYIDETAKSATTEAAPVAEIPPLRQPSPPAVIEHVEDKAHEEVIIPKIVAHETEAETETSKPHHVRPIDITPLPEDEPIPVGIPEVRTTETVKEEREKLEKAIAGPSTSAGTSSEEDKAVTKEAAAPRRADGFVNNIKRRCAIL